MTSLRSHHIRSHTLIPTLPQGVQPPASACAHSCWVVCEHTPAHPSTRQSSTPKILPQNWSGPVSTRSNGQRTACDSPCPHTLMTHAPTATETKPAAERIVLAVTHRRKRRPRAAGTHRPGLRLLHAHHDGSRAALLCAPPQCSSSMRTTAVATGCAFLKCTSSFHPSGKLIQSTERARALCLLGHPAGRCSVAASTGVGDTRLERLTADCSPAVPGD